jgi:hypothetical protein
MEPRQRALTRSVSRERSRSGSPSACVAAQQPKRRCTRLSGLAAAGEGGRPFHRGGGDDCALGGGGAPACLRSRRSAPPPAAPHAAAVATSTSAVCARRQRAALSPLLVPLYDSGAGEQLQQEDDAAGARVEGWFERVRRVRRSRTFPPFRSLEADVPGAPAAKR